MTSLFFSAALPWLLVMLLLQNLVKKNHLFTSPVFPFALLGLAVAGVLSFRVGGLSLGAWSATLNSSVSVPLLGLLFIVILEPLFSFPLFLPRDWKTAAFFGVAASLVLYPAALGLGRVDPYTWGWGFGPFFFVIVSLTLLLLLLRNRFGILLLLAIVAFELQLQESTNFWDYLLDPMYAAVAGILLLRDFFSKKQVPQSHLFFQ